MTNNNLIYREEILEHWRNPQNWGEMQKPDLVIEQVNPLCGDEITLYIKVKNKKVFDIKFKGSGCAISIASASILSENIKNKPLKSLSKITGGDVLKLIGGEVAPARLKCAFLPLEAIKSVVNV